MLKIRLLVSLGHHGGRRKVASLRPPFSTPLRSLGEPDPDTPFLVPIEHAPPLFVRIWEDKISLKISPAPLAPQISNPFINAKDPTLSILGHHGGRRKVASLRPPFSTPATPRDKPEPAGPFPPSIERAPPLFVRIPVG